MSELVPISGSPIWILDPAPSESGGFVLNENFKHLYYEITTNNEDIVYVSGVSANALSVATSNLSWISGRSHYPSYTDDTPVSGEMLIYNPDTLKFEVCKRKPYVKKYTQAAAGYYSSGTGGMNSYLYTRRLRGGGAYADYCTWQFVVPADAVESGNMAMQILWMNDGNPTVESAQAFDIEVSQVRPQYIDDVSNTLAWGFTNAYDCSGVSFGPAGDDTPHIFDVDLPSGSPGDYWSVRLIRDDDDVTDTDNNHTSVPYVQRVVYYSETFGLEV